MRPPASPNYDRSARRLRTTPRTPKTPKTPKGDRSPLFFTPETFWPNTPSTPKDDSINRLTERLGALSIQTPGKQRETSQPKPTFDLNLSGSDASNCSNDSSYGFNNLSVNKALRGLLHNEQDLVASPILPRKPKIPPPSFYFPQGKPVSQAENTAALRRGLEVFRTIPGNVINYENMDQLCQAVGIPVYWKKPMFSSILYPKLSGAITITEFSAFWTAMTTVAHDEAARFVYILTGGKATEIKREHLRPLIHDVILTHPGLAFYRTSVEFHDKYCDVVITRVFWNHRRTWALHITAEDLRRGDFLESVRQLELEEDINKNLRYFSYEHFYVVYCLFWEIDQDHDLKIRPDDLARHQRGAITRRVVERIFSRAVSKHPHYKTKEIGLVEFTQFLLADEDKQHPSSIDYWFRIMDEDGDGVISLYDMETYFGGIQEKLSEEGIDCMKFSDVACHLIDAIQPKKQNSFRRADFMNNKLSPKFFNSFVNFRKFYYQETTEGSEPRLEDASGQELTDWDRFCVEEYEALMDQSEADNVDSYDLYLEDDEETRAGSGTYNELL